MPQSTVTANSQTTVPKEIRKHLSLRPGDGLCWEITDEGVRITRSSRAFLERQGSIKTGPGPVVQDIRRARRERGTPKS